MEIKKNKSRLLSLILIALILLPFSYTIGSAINARAQYGPEEPMGTIDVFTYTSNATIIEQTEMVLQEHGYNYEFNSINVWDTSFEDFTHRVFLNLVSGYGLDTLLILDPIVSESQAQQLLYLNQNFKERGCTMMVIAEEEYPFLEELDAPHIGLGRETVLETIYKKYDWDFHPQPIPRCGCGCSCDSNCAITGIFICSNGGEIPVFQYCQGPCCMKWDFDGLFEPDSQSFLFNPSMYERLFEHMDNYGLYVGDYEMNFLVEDAALLDRFSNVMYYDNNPPELSSAISRMINDWKHHSYWEPITVRFETVLGTGGEIASSLYDLGY